MDAKARSGEAEAGSSKATTDSEAQAVGPTEPFSLVFSPVQRALKGLRSDPAAKLQSTLPHRTLDMLTELFLNIITCLTSALILK